MCEMCLENIKEVVLTNCGHLVSCSLCITKLESIKPKTTNKKTTKSKKFKIKCPKCSAGSEEYVKIVYN